uniref:transposase n=1 Tax=Caldicellulosiruptor acetigenus TaxID=301953 RepID=UPI001E389756
MQKELHAKIRAIFEAPDAKTARVLLNQVLEEYRNKAPKAMEVLEEGFEDAIAVLELPEPYRRRLRTTNMLERLNGEIRQRERVIRYLLAESRVFA